METSVHHPTIVVEQQHMLGIQLTSLEEQTMSEGVIALVNYFPFIPV